MAANQRDIAQAIRWAYNITGPRSRFPYQYMLTVISEDLRSGMLETPHRVDTSVAVNGIVRAVETDRLSGPELLAFQQLSPWRTCSLIGHVATRHDGTAGSIPGVMRRWLAKDAEYARSKMDLG